jgi:hypothetical protein
VVRHGHSSEAHPFPFAAIEELATSCTFDPPGSEGALVQYIRAVEGVEAYQTRRYGDGSDESGSEEEYNDEQELEDWGLNWAGAEDRGGSARSGLRVVAV